MNKIKRMLLPPLLAALISSCAPVPTQDSVASDEMTSLCADYIVLTNPRQPQLYVLIDRNKIARRYILIKDLNYRSSGFGYMFSALPDMDEALKNGVYPTARKAAEAAVAARTNELSFWLGSINPEGGGRWTISGSYYDQVCPDEKGYDRN